ncbi:MAG: SDR family oxidoreductase [Planctomycetota bacterium]|nr:SDR family oxidoreductase [Planctomycetota bacterium]MDA1106377.1 SDR family oxidoreductase [Planctomycetota bacterium]
MADATQRPLALVTGASSGIGWAFSELLAEHGHDLVLVARRGDRLRQLAERLGSDHGVTAHVCEADLSVPGAPATVHSFTQDRSLHVGVLVNNAGYGLGGSFLESSWETHRAWMEVMAVQWLHLSHLYLPAMLERRAGRIINVASLAAFCPEPPGSNYPAVKAFMVGSTRALSRDLRGTGVTATAVCPGFTDSEFHDVLGSTATVSKIPRLMWMRARPVVEQGWRAAQLGRPVVITGFNNKCVAALCWLLPGWLLDALAPKAVLERTRVPGRGPKTTSAVP